MTGIFTPAYSVSKRTGSDGLPANPLSRPFWLGAGFRPTGYGVLRTVDAAPHRG